MISICNPGNLRCGSVHYSGEVVPSSNSHFRQFVSMAYGYRAVFELLNFYINHGFNSVSLILNRYAPSSDHNDTMRYILHVCTFAGVSSNQVILVTDFYVLIKVVIEISYIENGVKAVNSEVIEGFRLSSIYKKEYNESLAVFTN